MTPRTPLSWNSFRIRPEDKVALDQLAAIRATTRGAILRQLVESYLSRGINQKALAEHRTQQGNGGRGTT